MALNPEVIFDNIVKSLGDFEDGGYSYYFDYYAATRGNNSQPTIFGNIIDIECSELDPTIHTSQENGLKKKVFSFNNGVDFYVSLYCTHVIGGFPYGSYEVDTVWVQGCLKKGNTFYYPGSGNFYLATAGGETHGSEGYVAACPVGMVKQHGIKIVLNTNYTYGIGEAVEGQTRAAYLDIGCLIPSQTSDAVSGFQSWNHIRPHSTYYSSIRNNYDDYENNPLFISFGYDHFNQGNGVVFRCDNLEAFKTALNDLSPIQGDPWTIGQPDPTPPSQEDDPSGPGGGGGDLDPGSDPIPFPDLPVGGALSSGAITAFKVEPNAMTQVFNKLWDTSIFDFDNFQKLVENPLDSLIQLQCVPMVPSTGRNGYIKLGNFDTQVPSPIIDQEYYTIDCGSLTVTEYWGSALDYSPYTKAEIWVPMIGFRDLDINDIMGKTIHLKYNYSIFDGNLTAQLMCGNAVLYKWPGNVKEVIPVQAKVSDALQRIVSGGLGVLTAGTGAGMAAAAIGAAVNVAMSKTHVSRTGEMAGSTGLLDDFMPFLILHRPYQSLANNFKKQKGYPSNISSTLSSLSGYTEVEYIHLNGIDGATDTELSEIENLLKSGVII